MIPTVPGYYPDVPRAEYERIDAASYSRVRPALGRTWAHARYAMDHLSEPTPALRLGHALHLAVLEPGRYAAEVVVAPNVDRRTKEGKADWAAFVEGSRGRTIISAADAAAVEGMAAGVLAADGAGMLALPRHTEATCYWLWDGVPVRARLDAYLHQHGVVLDLKSTRDASPDGFARSIHQYGYHVQAALYCEAIRATRGEEPAFAWLAVENEAPYLGAVYEADAETLGLGLTIARRLVTEYGQCVRYGKWPGYQTTPRGIGIPEWALIRQQREEAAYGG